MPDAQAPNSPQAQPESKTVRLHITPFRPDLLKIYLAPSVLLLAQNISYHTVDTFPEKGFGYLELPEGEAQKIKKKLNGTILKGSKVRIEMAKPEKRKAREEAEAAKEARDDADRPSKRAKKDKKEKKERKKKEQGVLEGVELTDDRKVKRGWTEPVTKTKKDKKEKKDKRDKEAKKERKHSKYTKEPELLFKAKLTPVAATEVALKDKKKDKKEKKEKNKSRSTEIVVHEFEKNTKTPSFLKQPDIVVSKKPAVDYINGLGWVDEDGVVVEPETVKAKARRALELVDAPSEAAKAWIDGTSKPSSTSKVAKEEKKMKKATPPPSSSESSSEESSVISSSSEDEDSSESESEESAEESEAEESEAASPAPSAVKSKKAPETSQSTAPAEKEVHPLEALFKRSKPTDNSITTPTKKLNPIDTSFTFFDNNPDKDATEATGQPIEDAPITPYTQRDIEWRGLRSAAPTPDTAAIGRRFSFDWRRNSQERDDDEDDSELDVNAEHQLSLNTRTNASTLADVTEEDEGATADGDAGETAKPESEFKKWFWENRGDLNRAWKKRRRDALKAKRLGENRKMTRRIV